MKYIWGLVVFAILSSCSPNITPQGNSEIVIFDNTQLYFDMALKSAPSDGSLIYADAGRVIIKKIKLPNYVLHPQVTLSVSLHSNGDPWDKSGSVFVIPKSAGPNLLDFENGTFNLEEFQQDYPGVSAYLKPSLQYTPNLELLRFMTPFGVGYFNEHERTKNRKPIYIPQWEEEVKWTQDVTHLLPALEDEVYIGVYIDTWDKKGYRISATLDFAESTFDNQLKKATQVLPLVNTIKYAAGQKHYDGFNQGSLNTEFILPKNAHRTKLHYITTGHGGHSTGDEFVKRENIISIDGSIIKKFIPWRDDCASFRRFNPSSGTWQAKDIMENSDSTEHIASSDFSRSNWCPGSDVLPEVIDLSGLTEGKHTLSINIPEAQLGKDDEHNYWMVSAYITYELK